MENEETIEKGIDLAAKETKETIMYTINNSNLPPVIVKYILSELLREVENIEQKAITQQSSEYIENLKAKNNQNKK